MKFYRLINIGNIYISILFSVVFEIQFILIYE